jgi:hypothetical protein
MTKLITRIRIAMLKRSIQIWHREQFYVSLQAAEVIKQDQNKRVAKLRKLQAKLN